MNIEKIKFKFYWMEFNNDKLYFIFKLNDFI